MSQKLTVKTKARMVSRITPALKAEIKEITDITKMQLEAQKSQYNQQLLTNIPDQQKQAMKAQIQQIDSRIQEMIANAAKYAAMPIGQEVPTGEVEIVKELEVGTNIDNFMAGTIIVVEDKVVKEIRNELPEQLKPKTTEEPTDAKVEKPNFDEAVIVDEDTEVEVEASDSIILPE